MPVCLGRIVSDGSTCLNPPEDSPHKPADGVFLPAGRLPELLEGGAAVAFQQSDHSGGLRAGVMPHDMVLFGDERQIWRLF